MKDSLQLKGLILLFFSLLFLPGLRSADQVQPIPTAKKHQALNQYVEFANECTHILSGVRERLEGFNREAIQYLASNGAIPLQFRMHDMIENYQFHSTFQGPCLWVEKNNKGTVNIQSLYKATSRYNHFIPADRRQRLNSTRNKMMYLMIEFLGLCDTLEHYTVSNRYYNEPELKTAFWALRRCETLYQDFRELNLALYDQVLAIADPAPAALLEMRDMIAYSREIIRAVRYENIADLNLNLIQLKALLLRVEKSQEQLKKDLAKLNLNIQNSKTGYENMIVHAHSLMGVAEDYLMKVDYDANYQVYGKGYFYFNHRLLDVYNHHKYGMLAYYNRFLSFANTVLVKMIEEPPIFQVVYKLEAEMPLLLAERGNSKPSIASMATRKKYLTPTPNRRPVPTTSPNVVAQKEKNDSPVEKPVLSEALISPDTAALDQASPEEKSLAVNPVDEVFPESDTTTVPATPTDVTIQPSKVLAGAAPNHLVFLVDISSSMNKPEKLPLLRESLIYLMEIMRPEDRLTLIAYAGKATVRLEASSAADKASLISELNRLHTGGETKIRRGLKTAYKLARKHFIPNGNNRIILASDGMVPMNRSTQKVVKKMAWEDIAFSTFHLTKGNSTMVQSNLVDLAKLGTGHYHHVEADNAREAILSEARAVMRR
jgi:Mg-chelatase subunit ChlD